MISPQAIAPAAGYAGDITPQQAWQWVQDGTAVLVDVRSSAELEWVGCVPNAAAVPQGQSVVLLCRSGVRSIAAAKRATELGLTAYNILEGFEGEPDDNGQRGRKGGWRFHGLPWRQG